MLVRGGSILMLCSLILAGKEGQEILGPEARADEVGGTGNSCLFHTHCHP